MVVLQEILESIPFGMQFFPALSLRSGMQVPNHTVMSGSKKSWHHKFSGSAIANIGLSGYFLNELC
jgi:hypothetical protein